MARDASGPSRALERPGLARLAEEFEMSGGYVKNAVLRAAFMSASEGSEITNEKDVARPRARIRGDGKLFVSPLAKPRHSYRVATNLSVES